MLKQLATALAATCVTFLPCGAAPDLFGQEAPSRPLFTTVFLKPGEAQELVFSTSESKIGARDRTGYDITRVNEAGEKSPAITGVAVTADMKRMGELWDQHGARFVAIRLSVTKEAEPGTRLVRVRATPFVGPPVYETTVRLVISR